MESKRQCEWGNWGITFYEFAVAGEITFFAKVDFAVGAHGPIDGFIGSPLRESYKQMCKDWREAGTVPTGALCHLSQKWLYVTGA